MPGDELEDVADLVLDLLAVLEFVDVDEKEVNSVVSVRDDDQDDEWNSDHPSDDATLEESVFHDLGEDEHHGCPKVNRHERRPELCDDFVVVRRVKVEFHEKNCASSQNQRQQDVLILVAVHEGETDNHDHLVEVEQEVSSGIHSTERLIQN